MMSFGPYVSFVVASYLVVTLVVAGLIAWIAVDHRSQQQRLRGFDESGVARRSGRSATEM